MKKRFVLIMLLMAVFAPLAMNAQGLMKASGITLQAAPIQGTEMQRTAPTRDAGWLLYDDGNLSGNYSLGITSGTYGAMYPSSMLSDNNTLTKVRFVESQYMIDNITIYIYSGGTNAPETLLYSEAVAASGATNWREVELAQAVTFDPSKNLWIIIAVVGDSSSPYIFPVCSSTEPNNQWFYYSNNWYNLGDLVAGLASNGWMIRGYVEYVDPTACPKPTQLTVSNITPNAAVLSWNSSDEVRSWQLAYSDREGFNPDDVTPIDVTANPYTLTGLTDGATYYAYVRANCGDSYSEWSSMVSFSTPSLCDAPFNVNVSNITPASANISWEGWQNTYSLRYQVPTFFEDFNSGIPSDWTLIDNDGDGNNWVTGQVGGIEDTYCATSASYNSTSSTALTPDNWLVTPKIALQGTMHVWMRAQDPSWPEEHFAIYLSNGGNTVNDFTTILVGETIATGEYVEYTADLSSYNGQMGYIAIRHFNCTDMFRLNVDNFLIADGGATINNVTSPYALTGLSQENQYFVQIQGTCPNGTTEWSNGVVFTTPSNCEAPSALTSADVTANAATLSWTGYQDSFNVQYRPVAYGEVIESQDFENSSMGNWTTIDADGDGYQWVLGSAVGGVYLAEGSSLAGSGNNESQDLVVSGSYSNVTGVGALTPDNYLVSPQVELGGRIIFWACGQDASYVAEHFGVAVSKRGNTDASDFETIAEWTMTAKSSGAKVNPSTTRSGNRAQGTWYQYIVDLSDFAGQTGYVAIRHFNCTDQFMLDVDDIVIEGPATQSYEWTTVTANENSINLTGLTPETEYEWQVQGVNASCDGGVTVWSETGTFTTLSACQVPTDLEATDITATGATLSWTGIQDSYNLRYRTSEDADILFYDSFDDGTIGSWTTEGLGDYSIPYEGFFAFQSAEGSQYLISPELSGVISGSVLQFVYEAYSEDYTESFKVGFSSTDNAIDSFTWGDEISTNSYGAYNNELPEGTKYFAIQCTSVTYALLVYDFMAYANYVPAGEWIEVNNVTSPYTLTGLNPETYYDWQVSGAECTEWSNIEYFTTLEQTTQTLTVNLSSGWNWISCNVEVTLADLQAALVEAMPEATVIKIFAQNGDNTSYLGNGRWRGTLTSIDLAQMYMVQTDANGTMTLTGNPVNPAGHPVTIVNGVNYFGFPLSSSMTLSDAFNGFATSGDKVLSQQGQSSYLGNNRWRGDVASLEPGKGYIYMSESTETRTLVFQSASSKAAQTSTMSATLPVAKKQAAKTVNRDAKRINGKLEIAKRIRK